MLNGNEQVGKTRDDSSMIFYCDKNLTCRFANEAFLRWFSFDLINVVDKFTFKELLGTYSEKILPFVNEVLKGKIQVFELDLVNHLKVVKQTIVTLRPDFGNNEVVGFNAYMADITLKPALVNKVLSIPDTHTDSSADKSLQIIIDNLNTSLLAGFPGTEVLAKLGFISTSKLKRDFRLKFGKTVFAYYRHLQMELAHKYITEKKHSKKQIAAMFNFSNPSNFTSCYLKYLKDNEGLLFQNKIRITDLSLYESFIKDAPSSIAMFDMSMGYIMASKKWLEYYGVINENIVGTNIFEILPGYGNEWINTYEKSLLGHQQNGYEKTLKKDGSLLWIRWEILPWYKTTNTIGGVLILIQDITALKLTMPTRFFYPAE